MRELNVVIGVAALDSGPNGFGATYVQWSIRVEEDEHGDDDRKFPALIPLGVRTSGSGQS
jgi:hypothetical protein